MIGFTVEEACRLYSVLPSELDEQSVALLTEDLDNMCRTIFGVGAFLYDERGVMTNESWR